MVLPAWGGPLWVFQGGPKSISVTRGGVVSPNNQSTRNAAGSHRRVELAREQPQLIARRHGRGSEPGPSVSGNLAACFHFVTAR